jgi:glycerol-3-phosphate acyltransferase PlsX
MTDTTSPDMMNASKIILSVDAMGGDLGPKMVVYGLAKAAHANPNIGFILHGDQAELEKYIKRRKKILAGRYEIRHCESVVAMDAKPSYVMRHARGTSMYSALSSVRDQQAHAVISCGNTGALMAIAMMRLRVSQDVKRPAIACLWPSRSASGFNILLDCGADIRADADDLYHYAVLGADYAQSAFDLAQPRVGILNVGTEDNKGRVELKDAAHKIAAWAGPGRAEFCGFVEGGDLPSNNVDVIVTDGFSGNIALKTGEGTAKLIREFLQDTFRYSLFSRLAAMLAYLPLKRLSRRIDPRRVNGGVFLGLNGIVVKSHGSSDATGIAAAIKLATQLAAAKAKAQPIMQENDK